MAQKPFQPLTKNEELALLVTRQGRSQLKAHLSALIDVVARKTKFPLGISRQAKSRLLAEIPVLTKQYLKADRHYKLSTFFDWRVRRRLNELRAER